MRASFIVFLVAAIAAVALLWFGLAHPPVQAQVAGLENPSTVTPQVPEAKALPDLELQTSTRQAASSFPANDTWPIPSAPDEPAPERGEIRVAVVDEQGRPVPGYPVALCTRNEKSWVPIEPKAISRRRADDSGIVRFALGDLQSVTRGGGDWFAVGGLPWHYDRSTQITRTRADRELWTLTVCNQGVLRIDLVHPDGTLWNSGAYVYGTWDGWRRNGEADGVSTYWLHDLPFDQTVRLFADAGGERPLEELGKLSFHSSSPFRQRRFVVGSTLPRLTGRFLLPNGSPLASQALRWDLFDEPDVRVNTDAEGRFEATLAQGKPRQAAIEVAVDSQHVDHRLAFMIPLLSAGQTIDLGELVFEPIPFLVRGIVRLPDGRSPQGIVIRAIGGEDGKTRVGRGRVNWKGEFQISADVPANFRRLARHGEEVARLYDGLMALKPGEQLRLQIEVDSMALMREATAMPHSPLLRLTLPEPTTVLAGASNVTLDFLPSALVRVRLRGPGSSQAKLRFVYSSGREWNLAKEEAGLFTGWLSPGYGELQIYRESQASWLTTVSNVTLLSGDYQDERLGTIEVSLDD